MTKQQTGKDPFGAPPPGEMAALYPLADLRSKGHIRYAAVSNFAAWQVVKAQWIAAEFDLKIDVLQPMYNLVKRQAEVEILPMCADQGVACAPYSPLVGGLLTGKYARAERCRGRKPGARFLRRPWL